MVFPRPNCPQFEKATSRDPLSSRDPLLLALAKEVQEGGGGSVSAGGGGPSSKGSPGSWCSSAFVTSESLLNHFCVTFTGAPKVTFESLFRIFELFGASRATGPEIQNNQAGQK